MSEERRSIYSPPDEPRDGLSSSFLVLGAVAFLAAFAMLSWLVELVGLQELQLLVAGAGIWGPLIYVGIKALTFTFAPLTAGPIQLAAGILFGIELGTFYSLLGEVIGGTINVIIGRLYGRPLVQRFVGQAGLQRVDRFYERYLDDWKQLFVARLLLFSVYDFISYAVGLGRIRLLVYIVISFVGGWGPTYVTVRLGAEAAQNSQLQLSILLTVGVLALLYIIFRRRIERIAKTLFG